MIDFVTMYSGGLTSYAAARRVNERHPESRHVLLFADTKIEDSDLYRFRDETARFLGCELVILADGRTPWELFRDHGFIGNSRVDICSRELKRNLLDLWCSENTDPVKTVYVFGLDWNERHRIQRHRSRMEQAGRKTWYPLDEKPYLTKQDIIDELHADCIMEPRLYQLGFPHNNCGGFCVKMGHAQARHLLATMPERYAWHEEQERAILVEIPRTKPFLRFRTKRRTRGVSLREFRKILEQQPHLFDADGWGCGGGCAID
jgi:hypothetical protein